MLCLFLLWPSMSGGAALKSLRLRHRLTFSLSRRGSWMLTSKHTLFRFFERSMDTHKNLKKEATKPRSVWIHKTNEQQWWQQRTSYS